MYSANPLAGAVAETELQEIQTIQVFKKYTPLRVNSDFNLLIIRTKLSTSRQNYGLLMK